MYIKTVNLWENTPGMCEETPVLDIYIPEKQTSRIGVVICPGGAYAARVSHEGKGYAEFLNTHGIAAFVCQYRVAPHRFPLPLLDARRAMRYVRFYGEEYGIDVNQVYIMGSSAGGHLAALTSTYHKELPFEDMDEIDQQDYKPNGQILCYPVISLFGKGLTHFGSGQNLLDQALPELGEELSPHLLADETTPSAFLWHTFSDAGVNVNNTLLYAKRLRDVGVCAEVHIYPYGPHGLGLAADVPHTCNWSQELLQWLALQEQQS